MSADKNLKKGYYLVARSIHDHELYKEKLELAKKRKIPFTKFDMFQDIFRLAQFKDTSFLRGYESIALQRGQLFNTILSLAERWGVNRDIVRKALGYFEKEGMILTLKRHDGLIITVCNYDKYQDPKSYCRQQNDSDLTEAQQERDTDATYIIKENERPKESSKESKGDGPHSRLFDFYKSLGIVAMASTIGTTEKRAVGSKLKTLTEDQIRDAMLIYRAIKKNRTLFRPLPGWSFLDFIQFKVMNFITESETDKRPYYNHLAQGKTEADVDRWFTPRPRSSLHIDEDPTAVSALVKKSLGVK